MENINEFTCNFCNKQFKNKSAVNHHIKTAKYCLAIQNKEIIIEEYKCEYCKCILKNKRTLQSHILTCKEKSIYDANVKLTINHKKEVDMLTENHIIEIQTIKEKYLEEINEQKIYIASLEAKIEIYEKDHDIISDIAKQTKITNTNNIINNLSVYDIDKITENFSNKLEFITKEDIINGQKGIANILAPCLFDSNGNKMITCTDKSRLMFTKIDEKNNKIKDCELKNLASVIKPLALKQADKIVEEHNKLREQIYNIDMLKTQNEEYKTYIKNFEEIINGYKKSKTHDKLISHYQNKINEYSDIINTNNKIILDNNQSEDISAEEIDDQNEKLLDGHTEIQYLDKETSKFARQMSKII
jgi:hypothetical protein